MTFANKLQELRKSKGFSQEYLAEKCNVSRQSVSKWETGLGYPETEKLLVLCGLLDVDLDYLLRDKLRQSDSKATAQSPYTAYLKKWVKLFLNDKEFNGFYCVAIIEIGNNFLIFMDEKGKMGMLNISAITSVSEADTSKYKELPELFNVQSEKNNVSSELFIGKACDVKLRQEAPLLNFTKPGGIYNAHIVSITDNEIILKEQNEKLCTITLSNVLFIKER